MLDAGDSGAAFTSSGILSVVVDLTSAPPLETLLSSSSGAVSRSLRLGCSSRSGAGITVSFPEMGPAIGLVVIFLHILLGGLGEECLRTTI